MTFVNDPIAKYTKQPPQQRQQPQPQQPPNTVAVGFWADYPTYKKYQIYAQKLYDQIITDEKGNQKRMLEHNDVNEFMYFAVEFFINNLDMTEQLQKSGNLMGVVKDIIKKIGPIG